MKILPIIARSAIPMMSLGLIGAGLWFIYWPASLVTVGGLLWIDLLIGSLKR